MVELRHWSAQYT